MSAKLTGALLYLDGVEVSFDGYRALRGLSLTVEPGELRAVIGPNGAGKTTMMDVITGKTRPDGGDVTFDGTHDLLRLDEAAIAELGIGRKFQKPTVFENQSVEDNLLLALAGPRGVWRTLTRRASRSETARLEELLDLVGLAERARHRPHELSGGEQQRVAIARALANDPPVILGDEVTGNLDGKTGRRIVGLLQRLAHEGRTVVLVTHDQRIASEADRRIELEDGRLVAEETAPDRREL